jgi:hypothetical protein
MLKIGSNSYEMVDAQSYISVSLFPPGDGVIQRQQLWGLTASFAPEGDDYTPPNPWTDEYLELWMRAEKYDVPDWRELTGFGLGEQNNLWPVLSSLSNRLEHDFQKSDLPISVHDLKLERVEDFIFRCELHGTRDLPDDAELDLTFFELLIFKEVVAYVPLNSADSVAVAKAMAAKYIKLTEFASHRVTPYDPKRGSSLNTHINTHHMVTLQTAWR